MYICVFFFFFKQKTAYEMRISDWSSDVCSSDLRARKAIDGEGREGERDGPYPERAEQEQHDAQRRLQGTDHGSAMPARWLFRKRRGLIGKECPFPLADSCGEAYMRPTS